MIPFATDQVDWTNQRGETRTFRNARAARDRERSATSPTTRAPETGEQPRQPPAKPPSIAASGHTNPQHQTPNVRRDSPGDSSGNWAGCNSEPRTSPVSATARSSPKNPSNATAATHPTAAVSSGLCAAWPCWRAICAGASTAAACDPRTSPPPGFLRAAEALSSVTLKNGRPEEGALTVSDQSEFAAQNKCRLSRSQGRRIPATYSSPDPYERRGSGLRVRVGSTE